MAFATVQEFANYMQADVQTSAAEPALEAATSMIQTETGQHFYLVADDVLTIPSEGSSLIRLPQRPVLSIASVTSRYLGETAETPRLADMDYIASGSTLRWAAGSYYRSNPRWSSLGWDWPEFVTVTYTHGYATIPMDVQYACLAMAAEFYSSPDGVRYEAIEDYSWRRDDAGKSPAWLMLKNVVRRYGDATASVKASR